MAKAKGPARVRAVATFIVGVRTVNAGEEFPGDDELVLAQPEQFEPVTEGEG